PRVSRIDPPQRSAAASGRGRYADGFAETHRHSLDASQSAGRLKDTKSHMAFRDQMKRPSSFDRRSMFVANDMAPDVTRRTTVEPEYIGIDLHKAFFQACGLTATAERQWE